MKTGRILYTKPWQREAAAPLAAARIRPHRKTHGRNDLPKVPEHSDNAGAEALALRIALYWAERGKAVSAFVVPLGELKPLDRVAYFGVRSDMVDGAPRAL